MHIEVIDIAGILERIKLALNIEKDADLARALGESPKKVAVWRVRNTVPFEELITFCRQNNLSFDWLILGKGEMRAAEIAEPILPYGVEQLPQTANGRLARKLQAELRRIVEEGDEKKLKAVESFLAVLDPGEKKSSGTNESHGRAKAKSDHE